MAQYSYDMSAGNPFSREGFSSGDTVSLVSSPSLIGGQSVRIVLDSGLYVGDLSDIPVTSVNTSSTSDLEFLALVWTAGNGAAASLYLNGSSDQVRLHTYTNQSILLFRDGDIQTSWPISFTLDKTGEWIWLRLRKRTNQWRGQAWRYGTPEPAGEAGSRAMSSSFSILDFWFAAYSYSENTIDSTNYVDFMSVGTNGDPAPRSKLQDYHVKDGGVWKTVDTLYARDGGVWKESEYHVRDGGVWKKVYG